MQKRREECHEEDGDGVLQVRPWQRMLVQRSATLPRQEGASTEGRGWFTDFHGARGTAWE